MSNAFLSHTAPVIERIEQLQKLEMSTSIHCSKANSLIRTFNLLPPFLSISPPNFKVNHKFIDAMNSIVSSIDHLIQLCIQCNRESCFQFILMTSLHEVFDQFLEIRQKVIADLRSIGFDSAADLFKLSPDELLSQDQVDLKLIGIFMMQMRSRNDVVRRPDIKEKINDRLKSIQRKGVKIETDETDLGGILTVPSLPPNLNLVLEHEQLVFGDSIGSGRSGRVFKGKISGSSQVVAIKVLHCRQLSPSELEMFCREIFTLSTLNHPSILKLLGYTNQPPFCLVTELLSNGSLFQFLKSHPDELTPTDRTAIAIDVARGMSYMHQRNIIHRDLKSLNILLDDNKRARICDFGLVRLKSYAPMTGLIGTTQWMAPEILMCSTSYDVAADVYSFGIVLWELLTGEIPYKDVTTGNLPYLVVQEGLRPTIPSGTPKDLENLITSCWSQDPKKRPPFSLIVKLFNNPKYHFPGTNADALWARIGGKKRKTPSASDPLKFFDNQKRLNQYEKNNLWIPVSQVDHVLMKFTEAIRTSNYLSIDRYLTDVRALGKSGLLTSTDFIPKVIELIRSTTDNQCQLKILKMLSELLINKVLFEQFINSDGLHLLYDLMRRGNKDIAEASLIICADHIQSEIISVDLIKALLVFNGATSEGTRLLALTSLFKVIDLKFDFLCSMPTFIYHLLLFSVKPLSIKVFEKLLTIVSRFLDHIKSFPEDVLSQLIWLQTNVPQELKSLAIECLTKSLKFHNAREQFPSYFWEKVVTSISDFNMYLPIYQSFVNYLPQKYHELLISLRVFAKEDINALNLLVEFSKNLRCAKFISTQLPIQNLHSPALLFQLYSNISKIEGVSLIIGQETEFYIVCKLVISSKFNSQACQLIRRVELSPVLLVDTGLLAQIVGLFNISNDTDEIFNLMSVMYTISLNRYFQLFSFVVPKMISLLYDSKESIDAVPSLKEGAFLCLVNFSANADEIDKFKLMKETAKFVCNSKESIQTICVNFAKKYLKKLTDEEMKVVAKIFVEEYNDKKSSHKVIEFANCVYSATKDKPNMDMQVLMTLHKMLKK